MADHPCTTCGHVGPPSIGDGACFSPSGCAVHGCYRVQAVAAADARAARAESESLAIALESAGRLREIWSAEYRAERAEAALRSIAQRCLHDVHGGAPADPACPACIARAALAPSAGGAAPSLREAVAGVAKMLGAEGGAHIMPVRDESTGEALPLIHFEYGGRDAWHDDCAVAGRAAPMKHLRDRLPTGDGVVLRLYECAACGVRVFGGCDRRGFLVRRSAASAGGAAEDDGLGRMSRRATRAVMAAVRKPETEMEPCAWCDEPTTTPLGYGECFCSKECLNAAHPDAPAGDDARDGEA